MEMRNFRNLASSSPHPWGRGKKKYAEISVVKHSSFPEHSAEERNENIISPENNGKSWVFPYEFVDM